MSQIIFEMALSFLLLAVCLWIALIDFRERRIPDLASLPLIGAGLVLSGFATHIALADRLIGAGAGFLLFWVIGEAYFRLRGSEALGIGDAKLFAAAGAWLGWAFLPEVLLYATVSALLFASLYPRFRQDDLAFGPWLAAGFMIGWFHLLLVS